MNKTTLLYPLTVNLSTSIFIHSLVNDDIGYNILWGTLRRYKVDPNEIPVEQQAGSTLPLMEMPGRDIEADETYNPFEHRKLAHPTS